MGFIRKRTNDFDAGNLWSMRTRACVDKDFVALQKLAIDSHLVSGFEARVSAKKAHAGMPGQAAFLTAAPLLHNRILPVHNLGKIDSDRAALYAPARAIPGVIGYLCRGDHCLRGCTAGVYTGAAQVCLLDERDAPAPFGQPIAKRISALAGPDYDRVEFIQLRTSRHFRIAVGSAAPQS